MASQSSKRARQRMILKLTNSRGSSPQGVTCEGVQQKSLEATDYSMAPCDKFTNLESGSISRKASPIKSEPCSEDSYPSPLDYINPTVSSTFAYFTAHFPTADAFQPPPAGLPIGLLSTFLLMYQSHSQRILDTFALANIEELQRTVTHFWSEMPDHLEPLLSNPILLTVVECVDSLLYRVSTWKPSRNP